MTASAPSRTAARDRAGHAAVLERAGRVRALDLQPDLGADALGQRGARTSGVEPSLERDDRVVRRRTAAGRGSARSARASADELLVDDPDRARPRRARSPARAISSTRGEEARLEQRVDDHHQPRVLPQALLHDRLDRRALQAEELRRPARARRAGRRPRGAGRRPTRRRRRSRALAVVGGVEAGGIIALIDVAEHRARRLRAAGARAGQRDLGDRRRTRPSPR